MHQQVRARRSRPAASSHVKHQLHVFLRSNHTSCSQGSLDELHFAYAGCVCHAAPGLQVIRTIKNNQMFYCATLHPDPAKQNVLLAGASDKRVYQFDLDTGDMVQVRPCMRCAACTMRHRAGAHWYGAGVHRHTSCNSFLLHLLALGACAAILYPKHSRSSRHGACAQPLLPCSRHRPCVSSLHHSPVGGAAFPHPPPHALHTCSRSDLLCPFSHTPEAGATCCAPFATVTCSAQENRRSAERRLENHQTLYPSTLFRSAAEPNSSFSITEHCAGVPLPPWSRQHNHVHRGRKDVCVHFRRQDAASVGAWHSRAGVLLCPCGAHVAPMWRPCCVLAVVAGLRELQLCREAWL
jgi:hypothetical protein